MTERKLATLQVIESLEPIEGADKIELLKMRGLGWQCVVQKGIHKVGDLVVYHEIDSFLDVSKPQYAWLEKNAITWEGIRGARIKSIRLRGQISQGVIIPLREFVETNRWPNLVYMHSLISPDYLRLREDVDNPGTDSGLAWPVEIGTDLTELLGILKWEKPVTANLSGKVRGNFPSHTPKTDEERIQNLWDKICQRAEMYPDEVFEVTEKLEGSSMTVYFTLEDSFGVCSRNLDLEETEDNLFWCTASDLGLKNTLSRVCLNAREGVFPSPPVPVAMSVQGELIGPGVQGNYYGLSKHQFRIFNIYDIQHRRYLDAEARRQVVALLQGTVHAPWQTPMKLSELVAMGIDGAIRFADGPSMINPKVAREGLVFKSREMNGFSFKIISNAYLLATDN